MELQPQIIKEKSEYAELVNEYAEIQDVIPHTAQISC